MFWENINMDTADCEAGCQCSRLITESFKINSGGRSVKRRRDESLSRNFSTKMTPYTLDFTSSTSTSFRQTEFQSPQTLTPSKRIILGNIQSPTASEINNRLSQLTKSPCNRSRHSKIHNLIEDRTCYKSKREKLFTRSENKENCYISLFEKHCESRQACSYTEVMEESSVSCHKVDSPVGRTRNVMCSRKKSLTWTLARLSSESPSLEPHLLATPKKETLVQLDTTSRDSGYEHSATKHEFYLDENTVPFTETQTFTKMLSPKTLNSDTKFGLDNDHFDSDLSKLNDDTDNDFQTLHDLEEFETGNVEECSKYEIISTDSPNIISRSTASTRRVESKNFVFGAPILDSEQSTSFNPIPRPNTATRMLNFDDTATNFEFASPANIRPKRTPATAASVKKALSFTKCDDTPTKSSMNHALRHERSDSSIGSMVSISTNESPCSQTRRDCKNTNRVGLFHSESTESGFMSEIEDSFLLDIEQTIHDDEINANSPKMANFGALISGTIKETLLPTMEESTDLNALNRTPGLSRIRRPILGRSMSMNVQSEVSGSPVDNVRLRLFKSSLDSPNNSSSVESRLRPFKRPEPPINTENLTCENVYSKRRKSSKGDEDVDTKPFRPVLQRAYSENAASVMSALARLSNEPDLIGDFSKPFSLPMMHGKHQDLKSISSDTLADLMTGKYDGSIDSYQVIDCRYPYEYEGGHIRGAANMYTREQLAAALISRKAPPSRKHILVFHCEFSLERGPNLSRFLRSVDRAMNKDSYPSLDYPEIYLLHDGYKDFHAKYAHLCEPNHYVPMLAPGFDTHLRQFRAETNNSAVDVRAVTSLRVAGQENAGPSRVSGLSRHKSRSRIFM